MWNFFEIETFWKNISWDEIFKENLKNSQPFLQHESLKKQETQKKSYK